MRNENYHSLRKANSIILPPRADQLNCISRRGSRAVQLHPLGHLDLTSGSAGHRLRGRNAGPRPAAYDRGKRALSYP